MVWLKVFEYFLIAVFLLFLLTQIIIPALRGQKLCPLFRKQGRLEAEQADAIQDLMDVELAHKTEFLRAVNTDYLTQKENVWHYEDPKHPNIKGIGATPRQAFDEWVKEEKK